ncbi:hypothetical protein Loa_02029 [Legionella oakridgensis ATCC 33761 = DSM 21215]|uniref:TfuA-like core domain-containing protein n=1 Tax=Legionella oakridgensis ATCC 33761 = DSM 21215 TaxID=1268635 RepID=W0BAK5_9GAMM|nr:hypothetical protein Loa_02029 [Legionella oakridgensis ATCC 33761 = DSM 21215]
MRQAHYHPPIQCGDILRLLRLTPKRIILIDGLYEQVPAVWHKEIMLALDRGVEVYGAASMGALRAAELHAFGMIGVGKIFQAYASHALVDDDEVAVLHYGQEQGSLPINDAMVNIRATLERAHREGVIGLDVKQSLTAWCKKQFYPSRSLRQALKQMNVAFPEECSRLNAWLNQYGLVDVKRHDAIEVLQHVQTAILSKGNIPTVDNKMPVLPFTKFIASLVDDVDGTPFHTLQDWLPDIEKKLRYYLIPRRKTINWFLNWQN